MARLLGLVWPWLETTCHFHVCNKGAWKNLPAMLASKTMKKQREGKQEGNHIDIARLSLLDASWNQMRKGLGERLKKESDTLMDQGREKKFQERVSMCANVSF
jgi:hypothetical protein